MNQITQEEWPELILGYLDDSLSDAEFSDVQELMDQPAFQKLLAEFAIDHGALCELGQQQSLPMPALGGTPWMGIPFLPSWPTALLLLAIFGMAGTLAWMTLISNDAKNSIAVVSVVEGSPSVDFKAAVVGTEIQSGDLIRCTGIEDSVELMFPDGSRLAVIGDSDVVCKVVDGQKQIVASSGNLWASVKPQPADKPMLVVTPRAEMQVLGTELVVSSGRKATVLQVNSGRVRMKRLRDNREVEVESSEVARASDVQEFTSMPVTRLPSTYDADFDNELPEGWLYGVREHLDDEVGFGIRAEFNQDAQFYEIVTPKPFVDGLFKLQSDTHINVRIRMENPGFYQILMGVRGADFDPAATRVYEFQQSPDDRLELGEWTTLSIPLSSFKQTGPDSLKVLFEERSGGPPKPGDVGYFLYVSSQRHDNGLELDRVWVSRNAVKLDGANTEN